MKHISQFFFAIAIVIFTYPVSFVNAGSSQATGEIHFKPEEIVDFAKKVEKTLAEKGARVAIVARVGRERDTLPEGVNYTHVGIAVYSQISNADGRKIPGYIMYNLYQRADEPDISDLIKDFPADFFAGVEVLEAGIIIPTPKLQRRILEVLISPTYNELHNPNYSVIANPFTVELQNCTEHTLDVITAAIYQTSDLNIIKANEKAYYDPQRVNISPIKLMLGSWLVKDVATSDHPGTPVTSTFTTIGQFLSKYNAASELLTMVPHG